MGDLKVNLTEESEMQSLTKTSQSTIQQPTNTAKRYHARGNFVERILKWKNKEKCLQWIVALVVVSLVLGLVLFLCFRATSDYNVEPKLTISNSSHPSSIINKEHKPENNVAPSTSTDSQQNKFCQDFSQTLFKRMNLSIDPCHDFHQYVCGSWRDNSKSWSITQLPTYATMQLALDNTKKSTSKVVQYVLDLYSEYLDTKSREELGSQPIQQLAQQVFGDEQWLVSAYSPSLSDQSKISDQFEQFWYSKNASYFYFKLSRGWEIDEFKQFWTSWMLWKMQSDNTFDETFGDTSNVHQWMDWYVEGVMVQFTPFFDILSWNMKSNKFETKVIYFFEEEFSDNPGEFPENYHDYMKLKELARKHFEIYYWNLNNSLDYALFESLDFRTKIWEIFKKSQSLQSRSLYSGSKSVPYLKTITLGELKQNYSSPHFDWTLLLNKFAARTGASVRYTDNDTVRVITDQLDLFKSFTELLVRTPIRVLKNDMGLNFIRKLSFDDRDSFVKNNFYNFFPIFVRLSVDYVGRQKMLNAREQFLQMIRQLTGTFSESLKHDYTWIDEKTRQKAINKLEAMKMMIAFPDWLLDDSVLDAKYGFYQTQNNVKVSQNVIKGHYVTSLVNFQRLVMEMKFRINDQILIADSETLSYRMENNLIGASYSFLWKPWFDVDYPAAINYANLGYSIAHEIIHAFDQEGRLYDKHGEKVNWWTNYTSKHFRKLSQCFVKQYNGLEEITRYEILKINSKATLAENIADNGGLNLAYRALEKIIPKYSPNTTFEAYPSFRVQFTPEQLFFVSYGTIWCSSPKDIVDYSDSIKHGKSSPNRIRVNIPLSNMAQFAKAFNCPVGSPMNPEHKCSIW